MQKSRKRKRKQRSISSFHIRRSIDKTRGTSRVLSRKSIRGTSLEGV